MKKNRTCKIIFSDIDGAMLTSDGQITEERRDDPES